MGRPLWRIDGFVTAAGNRVVQEWFWDELQVEGGDALRDRMNYPTNVGKNLWQPPYFDWFGDIGEVRKHISSGALRVYGFFSEEPHLFVFLHGVVKKKTKDREGIDLARLRLKRAGWTRKEALGHLIEIGRAHV